MGRSSHGNVCRVAHHLDARQVKELEKLAADEPVTDSPNGLPVHADEYAEILEVVSPIKRRWLGPAFHFPKEIPAYSHEVVLITHENIGLLDPTFLDWMPAVGKRDPVCLLVHEGQGASICYSPAISELAHEAGVETHSAYRGQGFAAPVVAAWASAVRKLGIEPLYSTSTDNLRSQSVAAKLGLVAIGLDFHLS